MTSAVLSDLTSFTAAARDVVDDLRQGCSVVWLFPSPEMRDQMELLVRHECARWEMRAVDFSLGSLDAQPRPLASLLADWLDLEPPRAGCIWTPELLVDAEGTPDVLILCDLEQLPEQEQARWLDFMVQWSHAAGAMGASKALLVPVASKLCRPVSPEVRLRVRRFWRWASQLELQTLAREQAGPDLDSRVWNEYVYASVAAGDPLLLDWLLDKPDLDGEELWEHLVAYGEMRGWTSRALMDRRAAQLCDLPHAARLREYADVPADFEPLWQVGALTHTVEYGLELQSAAAAMLGRRDVIEHRVWRGQVQALMPVLDALRQSLCHYLTRYHGPGWVNLADPQNSYEISGTPDQPLSEFNHMSRVLRSPALRIPQHMEVSAMVQELRHYRNCLAHYTPISRSDVARLFRVVQQLERLR
ncbi:MAG: hypothetical protein AB2385_12775 [Symbiobacterium sp.]|jgi:hypothetical protein|uniref:hypothetical protein n=1 Tax=Symbiobacterium sp. TaxID=1971213 RepID=UPI0034648F2A